MATATPNPNHPAEPQRPDLHVVPDPEPDEVPAVETDAEITGPIPVLDADGRPVTPQAPLDVRVREAALRAVRAVPALGKPQPSFQESLEYSARGDWATSEQGAKRVLHGLATIVAYLVTYLPVDVLGRARTKPGPFAIAVLIVLAALAALLATT